MKNSEIRLHIPAIPYTITRSEYSGCAFTSKVMRFAPMMRSIGFEVYHYGVETSESGANKNFDLLTKAEWEQLRIETVKFLFPKLTHEEAIAKNNDPKLILNDLSSSNSPRTKEFNKRFKAKLLENFRGSKTDIVCNPLGITYQDALNSLNIPKVEIGIGYTGSYFNFRIFESYGWMSKTLGVENKHHPPNYWFVVPHGFDTKEFKLSLNPTPKQIGFLGRICDLKGMTVIAEIAKQFPDIEFVICGPGDPTPYLKIPNIKYKLPIHGKERSDFLGECVAFLHPVKYLEPFGCGPVEAQLCGTPVICSDWGGLVETVEQYKTGLRCHTLADYCLGVQMALDGKFDRNYIRERSASLYDMYNLAHNYEYVFKTILDIYNPIKNGWYSPDSHLSSLYNYTTKESYVPKFSKTPRMYKFMPYYGSVHNYFQLYLDSLEKNKDCLTVFFISDIDLTQYRIPENFIQIKLTIQHLRNRLSSLLYSAYKKYVHPNDLLPYNYKFCDIKILYSLLFEDVIQNYTVKNYDYVGWGDCDLIYGKLSNFIDLSQEYGIIGGWHGHFTTILNNKAFKNIFTEIPNYFDIVTDRSRNYATDEIAYRQPLKKFIRENKLEMCHINDNFCDIVPPCYYHLSRPDHKEWDVNFYDLYNPTKNIDHLFYKKEDGTLTVHYENGETRETSYGHLQKRKMELPFDVYKEGYYINEHSFTLNKQ